MDSLRQTLMCYGDMTPIALEWSLNRGYWMPNFEMAHTCRDFDSLKAWAKTRDANHDDREQIAERIRGLQQLD